MRTFITVALGVLLSSGAVFSQEVRLVYDQESPQAAYAARKLTEALTSQGYSITQSWSGYDYLISIGINEHTLPEEAFEIIPEEKIISVYGGDSRGLIYGTLSLAQDLRDGVRLDRVQHRKEEAFLPFRGIKHNLVWDSYRPSSAIDQHYETTRDLAYWEAFLDMMVENRFNVLSLWTLHPYTYMIRPRNFPEASGFSEEELEEWRRLYQGIFRMATERGIDTYIISWSIFISRELAEAHGFQSDNYYPSYYGNANRSELVKRYIRESVVQMLEEYPDLTGIGVSHGEGMGGMTPQERQDWIDEVYVAALRQVDRPVKFIHRVPFSAGTSSAGSTSVETEVITRQAMERIDFLDGPIWVEMKFNWSHGHSTPKLVKVHGGELGDTYFVPEPTNYKVTWMIRNEDFFALRWGVPSFVREHVKLNGAPSYVGGYFVGSETYIPALDYFTAVQGQREWKYAFERQWLFYQLWGRPLYNPDTPDSVFVHEFERRYGERGRNLLRAYELASATPLRLASVFDATWDHTLYSEGFLSLAGQNMAYISVDRLIQRPVLDPDYVSIADFVAAQLEGRSFDANRVTPLALADRLEADCREALRLVEGIDTSGSLALMYEVADIRAWAHLGMHLAEKIRGGVALHTYRLAGGEENKARAIAHMESSLAHWDEAVAITRPIYRDMPLVHNNGNSFNPNPDNLFHWELIRPQVARDVEVARSAVAGSAAE